MIKPSEIEIDDLIIAFNHVGGIVCFQKFMMKN